MCLLLLFMVIISYNAYSQNCEVQNNYTDRVYSNEEIYKLEKRICSLLNESNHTPEDSRVNFYYIPNYELKGRFGEVIFKYKKSDFVDKSILGRLCRIPPIDINGEKYIDARVLVTNLSDSLIAFGNAERLFIAARYSKQYSSSDTLLIENKSKLDIKYFFSLTTFLSPVFGVTEANDIFVFLKGKVYSIEEFVTLYSENDFFKDKFYD